MSVTPPLHQGENTAQTQPNFWKSFWDFKASHWAEVILTGVLVGVGIAQVVIYNRQAGMMKSQNGIAIDQALIAHSQADISSRQADIMDKQASISREADLLTEDIQRAFVSAAGVRIDKKPGEIPGHPGQFETYIWFTPSIENGGSTPTKNLRISAQAYLDPSRPGVNAKLPIGAGMGAQQVIAFSHLPDAGPPDPEETFIELEKQEREGKPAQITRGLLGPHVSQNFGGLGVPLEETKRLIQDGGRWFVLGSIHYNDRFSQSPERRYKYCFSIGFTTSDNGEPTPTTTTCAHWNCADDECVDDKSAYEAETKGWIQTPVYAITPTTASPPNLPNPALKKNR
jgi:hypothetical protein